MTSRRSTAPAGQLLLIDSGNSRLKWALSRVPYRRQQSFKANGVLELSAVRRSDAALLTVLRAAGMSSRVWACNVAGAQIQGRIRHAAARAGLPAPLFLRSTAAAGGVRNGYDEPWRLGADRWAALIGAHYEYPGESLCIVGIGSAMTVDLLSSDGLHQGGCIIPGPAMMIASLLRNTAGIRRRAQLGAAASLARALAQVPAKEARHVFAHDTRSALLRGASHACASLIERACEDGMRRLGQEPRLLLTGGAASGVAVLVRARYRRRDDLVLRGLAVLAQPA